MGLTLVQDHAHNLGNNIASTTNNHGIAYANIFSSRFIFVVQRGIGHSDTAHKHRRQFGNWRQFTSPPHLHIDVQDLRQLFLSGKFMGHSPARFPGYKAQLVLKTEGIDFVNNTVNVIRQ